MALAANALTRVPTLRAWLTQGRTNEADGRLSDEALEGLIGRASAAIEGWCRRSLVAPADPQTYTFDGDGGCRLLLPEWPVVSFDSLTVDGLAIEERTSVFGAGYVVRRREGTVLLVGHRFAYGQQNVVVQARLGYDAALAEAEPRHGAALADLEQACLMLCALWFDKPSAGAYEAVDEGETRRDDAAPVPSEVQGLLFAYRRVGV